MNFNQVENCLMIRTSRKWLHKIERERDKHVMMIMTQGLELFLQLSFKVGMKNFASHLEK